MAKYVNLDDYEVIYCGSDGDYEKYNIPYDLPAADVRENVHAHWELDEDGWHCSACKLYPPFNCDPEEKGIRFCPCCGAQMDERRRENG